MPKNKSIFFTFFISKNDMFRLNNFFSQIENDAVYFRGKSQELHRKMADSNLSFLLRFLLLIKLRMSQLHANYRKQRIEKVMKLANRRAHIHVIGNVFK